MIVKHYLFNDYVRNNSFVNQEGIHLRLTSTHNRKMSKQKREREKETVRS